jgi:hypothetical protein
MVRKLGRNLDQVEGIHAACHFLRFLFNGGLHNQSYFEVLHQALDIAG